MGRELRRLRVSRGMSQRALTKQLGLSAHSNIADYESGRRIPPRDIVLECERVLGSNTLSPLLEDALAARAAAGPPKRRRWPYVAVGAAMVIAVVGAAVLLRRDKPSIWDGNDLQAGQLGGGGRDGAPGRRDENGVPLSLIHAGLRRRRS
ncbi:helix-turn-helix transcriptional regulator [Allorhizocola rhizosphaerae]|uniref:helix-turn-helix transcriptional regulator n=1 Tax=Allorhizocola rhizosphaerae TaxID=1872709 RepID=UPI0013C3134F|nr:helix-turn-helix transcriptional regulator [Allorhizocola rhizosphaerae]